MAKTRSKGGAASPASSKVSKPTASPKVSKTKAASKVKASPKPKSNPEPEAQPQPKPKQEASAEVDPSSIIPEKVLNKAISELKKFNERQKEEQAKASEGQKSQLFDADQEDEESFYVTIESKKFFSSKPQFKPKCIKLTKSIRPESTTTCLIIRDDFITSDEVLEALENDTGLKIDEFVPLKVVKTEYKNFEKRREFHAKYDFFLVDDSILNVMPNALGKIFYESNKFPVPVRLTSSKSPKELSVVTLKNQVSKALSSTCYLPPIGTNVAVKVGFVNYDEKDLVDNVYDVVKSLDIKGVKSIHFKSTTSPALPLFYTDKLYDEEDVAEEEEEEKEEEEEEGEGKLTAFERGLLELGDADAVAKVIGKKLGEKKSKKNGKPVKGKVSKK